LGYGTGIVHGLIRGDALSAPPQQQEPGLPLDAISALYAVQCTVRRDAKVHFSSKRMALEGKTVTSKKRGRYKYKVVLGSLRYAV
jgi:hypothetical protein